MLTSPPPPPSLGDYDPAYLQSVSADGVTHLRLCGAAGLCGLKRFQFTFGLLVNIEPLGYDRRYCFETEAHAAAALASWDGAGHPAGAWIKCKGASVEFLNPEFLSSV